MATLSRQSISPKLINPTYSACAGGGDKVAAGPGVFVEISNASGGSLTVTVNDPTSVGPSGANQFDPDVVTVIPAAQRAMIPLPARFGDPADNGLAALTYSGVTSLTIAAFQA